MKLYHTRFCTHLISKNISYNMYKIFLYTIFCLQTHFYVLYISLFKTTLFNFKFPSKFCFSLTFDLSRSTDRPTDPVSGQVGRPFQSTKVLAAGAYPCARFTVDRAIDRNLSDCKSFALCIFRSTESRQRLLFFELRSTDRSTKRAV